jgi:hypothetical protein
MTLEEQLAAATSFIRHVMWNEGNWCGDIDGGDIQDMAERDGLIVMKEVKEPCCEGCACADAYLPEEWPVQCFEYVDWMKWRKP